MENNHFIPDNSRTYIAIDLKSFYASVECNERELDPMTTNLVVADASRTEKTICLAVSPSLKAYGIPGRARLFQVVQKVKEVNAVRKYNAPNRTFTGKSIDDNVLKENPSMELDYIAAVPRMALYMQYSTRIYNIYLKYVAPEDIHVYSIDEVFMDVTHYLKTYKMTARQLAATIIHDVLDSTRITATAGIGTNLYLCKIAMDIVAKHVEADSDGVRIAQLDEMSYRKLLWNHRPLTDFWRLGKGYAKKLEKVGLMTMGDIARCSIGAPTDFYNEELLYDMFGVNAELLIDHAWGFEPCTLEEIKKYKPENTSISQGQVLHCPYDCEKTRLIVQEMTDLLVYDLMEKGLVTNQIVLTIGYDIENLTNPDIRSKYSGEIVTDNYGRKIPKHAHGTQNLNAMTSSGRIIMDGVMKLFDRIINPDLLVRRITIEANHTMNENEAKKENVYHQMDIFSYMGMDEQINDITKISQKEKEISIEKERKAQEAMLSIKKKYGKNAIIKGMNLKEGGTTIERNAQIGGHKA
ncbi:MAG: DNA methylase [Eubacteriales bacterium]|nr:DNA methylase [Eubacteriales bacterium]